jgi:hypothetical protein
MILIVSGSRDFCDKDFIYDRLDRLLRNKPPSLIIEGGARGVDSIARQYALDRGIAVATFHANWDKFGKRAGILRNESMAKVGTHLIAFVAENSIGTRDMVVRFSGIKRVINV